MSRSIHFISKSIPGCGPPDDRRPPCSGVSGRALSISPNSSCGDYKLISDVKFLSLKIASRYTSTVCNANSSNYRRNPDFSRQNKHVFSRHRNRQNEVREEYEDLEDSETLSSRNGPVLSFSGNQKFHATATPGPREKEIVELFRKVQVQLRERAATREGRKMEEPQGKSKESDTVDSLLKLLRKHSVQQGKQISINTDDRDFIFDQNEKVVSPSTEDRSTSISDNSSSMKNEMQESPEESSKPHLSRPKSDFRRRSPVPEIKFQPMYSVDPVGSISEDISNNARKWINLEPEGEEIQDIEYDSDSDVEPLIAEGNDFDDILADETGEAEHDDVVKEEHNLAEASDLHGMKVTELRALAKSRGMKGFSKLKKNELIVLLSESI